MRLVIPMNLQIGDVIVSKAGKDKDSYFCVVDLKDSYCFLRDGKIHKLEKPKRKKIKHVRKSPYRVQSEALQVNKHLKKAIDSLTNS